MNSDNRMIMRLFHVHAKAGKADELLKQFATTSAEVVRHKPGNRGYCFGKGVSRDEDLLVFASFWESLDSIKQRFGHEWQSSYLPQGYADLIDSCTVEHIDLSTGWFVDHRN